MTYGTTGKHARQDDNDHVGTCLIKVQESKMYKHLMRVKVWSMVTRSI